jgi:hypothetical protein
MNVPLSKAARLVIAGALALSITLFIEQGNQVIERGQLFTSAKWTAYLVVLGVGVLLIGSLLVVSGSPRWRALAGRLGWLKARPAWWRPVAWVYLVACVLFLGWLVMEHFGRYFPDIGARLPVFGMLSLAGASLLRLAYPQRSWSETLALATFFLGAGYLAISFWPQISDFPLSLGWSEASRYYYASLFLSERIYGMSIPPPALHPSRYLLQAIPFLINDTSLWFHRAWQVFLWISLPLLAAYLLARHFAFRDRWLTWMFALWAFLFIFQGPIYYHLTIILIIVLLGYDREHFWKTLLVVILGGLWGGISRVNWLPVAGMLAAGLYLIDHRAAGKPVWRYLVVPAGWFLGGALAGLGSQFTYAALSGNDPAYFTTSFTSDLLWERLWPNPTFPAGILPSILFYTSPLLLLVIERLLRSGIRLHPLRLAGWLGILLVFFSGGLVVSVKIGGGNDLHNLDAYLFLLLVLSSALVFKRFTPEAVHEIQHRATPRALLWFATVLPLLLTLQHGAMIETVDPARSRLAMERVQAYVDAARQAGGEVLFISERHLLTFGIIEDVPLIPDYERTFLMEMAMAGNMPYLQRFYDDLARQRFALIISQPIRETIEAPDEVFREENVVWVRRVGRPILCYYAPVETVSGMGLQFLLPSEPDEDCP